MGPYYTGCWGNIREKGSHFTEITQTKEILDKMHERRMMKNSNEESDNENYTMIQCRRQKVYRTAQLC